MTRSCCSTKSRGFSLIELLIVVTILFILGAIATPTLIRSIRAYQLESSARQVANMILSARYEAMRRNQRTCAVFDNAIGENRYGLDLNGGCTEAAPVLGNNEPFAVSSTGVFWFRGFVPAPPPDFTGLPVGYDPANSIAPPSYRVTFSPRGTLVTAPVGSVPAAATWLLPAQVHMIMLHRPIAGGDEARVLITVTPMGRIKLFRWQFGAAQWEEF